LELNNSFWENMKIDLSGKDHYMPSIELFIGDKGIKCEVGT